MVTIGSGGLGGGGQAMDILKRLGLKRGLGAAGMGAFGAPPAAPATPPTFGGGNQGQAGNVLSLGGSAPAPMEPPQPMRPDPVAVSGDGMAASSGMGTMDPMQAGKRFTNPGIMDRIGDFIGSDRGRATLLRSGAETMRNGLGAGIAAGAAYYDDQKEIEAKQMNWVSEMGLKTRQTDIDQQTADQTGRYQEGRIDVDSTEAAIAAANSREAARKNRVNEGIDLVKEEGTNKRFQIGNMTDQERIAAQREGIAAGERNNKRSVGASIYGTDSQRYIADENRAYANGDVGETTVGVGKRSKVTAKRVNPSYDQEIRYDDNGQPWRLDPFTGKPVRARGQ